MLTKILAKNFSFFECINYKQGTFVLTNQHLIDYMIDMKCIYMFLYIYMCVCVCLCDCKKHSDKY